MIQIVLDTNVLIAALRSKVGASYEILRLIGEGDYRFQINLSVPLVMEYEAVSSRFLDEFNIDQRNLDHIIGYLCSVAEKRQIHYLWRPFLSDPKDDMALEVAVAGRCDYIVTHNIKDFEGSTRFGVKAITPGEFLLVLGGHQ
jgi:putative PIN family toxin of toxin-antitoxin system